MAQRVIRDLQHQQLQDDRSMTDGTTSSAIVLASMAVVTIIATMIWTANAKPKHLRSRPVRSFQDIYRQYYANSDISREVVEYALDLVARAFGVEAGQIRPTDRFAVELRVVDGWDSYDSPLDELSEELRSHIGAEKLKEIHTVDDVVRSIAAVGIPRS